MADRRAADQARGLWELARQRARKAGVDCTLTVEDVRAVWPKDNRCPALRIPLRRGVGKQHDASPTLDRLNGAWGYVAGNVAVLSLRANRAKSSCSAAELAAIAKWMRGKGLA